MLRVPGKGSDRVVAAAVLLPDLDNVNSVRGIVSECLSAKGIDGAGHMVPYEQTEAFVSAVTSFLEKA